jgi:hypothetical protein
MQLDAMAVPASASTMVRTNSAATIFFIVKIPSRKVFVATASNPQIRGSRI